MIIPFLEPYLFYLALWYVFYPMVLLFLIAGVVCLPVDNIPGKYDTGRGVPAISLACNVALFAIVVYHFGIDVGSWQVWVPCLVLYLLFGVVWSFDKWRRLASNARDDLQGRIIKWCDKNNVAWDQIRRNIAPDDKRVYFYNFLANESEIRKYERFPKLVQKKEKLKVPNESPFTREMEPHKYVDQYFPVEWAELRQCLTPQVKAHKAQVIMWLTCWPMSVVKWLLADMVSDIVNFIFNSLRRQFQGVANSTFQDM